MVRKNIFEILDEKYDINREFERITTLFSSDLFTYSTSKYAYIHTQHCTLEKVVSKIFYQWSGRGTCLNYDDMRKELGIDYIIRKEKRSVDEILFCLEYYVNIDKLFMNKMSSKLQANGFRLNLDNYIILQENILKLLDYLNQQVQQIKDDIFIIIPKNPAATAVAEISSENTAVAIMMYHHASLKGKIEEKRKLLLSIAQEYETLLAKGIEGFSSYFDNARNMLNNTHLRHNNKSGKDKKELIAQMSNEELETWYDELYQLLLFCVLIKDNKDRKDKIAEFLKGLQEKKS